MIDTLCKRGPGIDKSFYEHNDVQTVEQVMNAFKAYIVTSNLKTIEQIQKELASLKVADDMVSIIVRVLEGRRFEIRKSLKEDAVLISHAHLQDFDWRLQVCNHEEFVTYHTF